VSWDLLNLIDSGELRNGCCPNSKNASYSVTHLMKSKILPSIQPNWIFNGKITSFNSLLDRSSRAIVMFWNISGSRKVKLMRLCASRILMEFTSLFWRFCNSEAKSLLEQSIFSWSFRHETSHCVIFEKSLFRQRFITLSDVLIWEMVENNIKLNPNNVRIARLLVEQTIPRGSKQIYRQSII